MLFNFILLVSLLSDIARSKAIPSALEYSHRRSLRPADIQKRGTVHGDCKKLKPFFDQTSRDWRDHNTDEWFQAWWTNHRKVKGTFTEVWGTEVLGNPDWCLNGDCAFRPCDISVPTDNDDDLRHAYYVTEAVSRLHSYFDDLSEAFKDSAIWAAFAKDKWSLTFHPDEHESKTVTKAGLISVGFVIAIAFAFGGVAGPLEAAFAGSGTALWSAGQSSLMTFDVHKDHSVTDAADLGAALGELVLACSKELVNADNLLMQGRVVSQSGDIRRFLRGGYWVDYKGLDRTKLVDNLAGFLLGNAINRIWRTQEVYIVGGPRCDRDDNGSKFDHKHSYCYKNKAYKLQRWQQAAPHDEPNGHPVGPFGADELGKGAYRYVRIADIIKASVDAYEVAGYEYTNPTAQARVDDALTEGWANPGAQGPSWEGTFTIPVCDVGDSFERSDTDTYKEGYDWRQGICSGDKDQTKRFMRAANREGWYKQVGGFSGDHKYDLD